MNSAADTASSGNGFVRLRDADANDVALLRYWDEQPHVIEAGGDDDWQWEIELSRSPDWREQLIAEVDGRPIGFMQIIDPLLEETHYWGDVEANLRAIDIWIGEVDALGKGYGTQMMNQALARCFDNPKVTAVLIDPLASNTRAHRFYRRFGYRFVEKRWFGEDQCFVFRLSRRDFQGAENQRDHRNCPA